MTTLTNEEVVAAMETISGAALPVTKIIPRQLLGLEDGESVNAFHSERDNDRINALMFWREAVLPNGEVVGSQLKTGPAPSFDPSRLMQQGKLLVRAWVYRFKFYYGYQGEGSNSQAVFDRSIDDLNVAFARKPKLGIDSYQIEKHGELFWSACTVMPVPDAAVHIGSGQLVVVVHRPATPS